MGMHSCTQAACTTMKDAAQIIFPMYLCWACPSRDQHQKKSTLTTSASQSRWPGIGMPSCTPAACTSVEDAAGEAFLTYLSRARLSKTQQDPATPEAKSKG